MAIALGHTLDAALLERLSGREPSRYRGLVLPLCTVGPEGWPHVALLSYAELVARDSGTLRAALYADSRSARHLREHGRATLLVFDVGLAQYIEVRASELQESIPATPWNAVFELRVEQVLSDAADPRREGGSVLTSGITFDPDRSHHGKRAAVLAALRSGG